MDLIGHIILGSIHSYLSSYISPLHALGKEPDIVLKISWTSTLPGA